MKKTFSIEVDCANCANLVENAARNIEGVKNVVISFMTQKMKIDFEDGSDEEEVLARVLKAARRIEPDFEIL